MRLYDEIIIKVADRLGLKESLVRCVLTQFFSGVSKRIQNPQEYFISSLTMDGWFYFHIDPKKLESRIAFFEELTIRTGKYYNKLDYYKKLLKLRHEKKK